jgi:hypothetical protein
MNFAWLRTAKPSNDRDRRTIADAPLPTARGPFVSPPAVCAACMNCWRTAVPEPVPGQPVRHRHQLLGYHHCRRNEFVVPGPGALDGISKCFTSTAGLHPAEIITWMRDTSPEHFNRIGLHFEDLRGRWPTLIDWQNVFYEVSKYTRMSHPHIPGTAGRTKIKQQFRQTPSAGDYRFPPKWGLPPDRTAILRSP